MEAFLKNFDLVPGDVPMIVLGAALFFMFCHFFGKKVIAPYLQLLETREAATEGALEEAAADVRAAAELQRDFESQIAQARVAAVSEKLRVLDAAKKDAAKFIENAEAQGRHILESERGALARSLEDARKAAHHQEESLVALVLQKLGMREGL